jgi:hypothetical protein
MEKQKKGRPKKKNGSRFAKGKILKAIKDSGGIISNIAEKLRCDWHTANKYANLYEETRLALEAETEAMIDNAENALHNLISAGDGFMIRYYLSTKGKRRGYVERVEKDITTNGNDINGTQLIFSPTPLSPKDIEDIKNLQSGKGSADTGLSET